jgi:hypothetical protein
MATADRVIRRPDPMPNGADRFGESCCERAEEGRRSGVIRRKPRPCPHGCRAKRRTPVSPGSSRRSWPRRSAQRPACSTSCPAASRRWRRQAKAVGKARGRYAAPGRRGEENELDLCGWSPRRLWRSGPQHSPIRKPTTKIPTPPMTREASENQTRVTSVGNPWSPPRSAFTGTSN